MKRDLELVKELMRRFESDNWSIPEGRTQWEVAYHVKQMIDGSLLEGEVVNGFAPGAPGRAVPKNFIIHDITWKGHDFLKAIRDETVWKRIVDHFKKRSVEWTVDLVLDFVKSDAKALLGM